MSEEFKFNGLTIVVSKKSIKKRCKDDVKIFIASNEQDITLPYYYSDDDLNEEGLPNTHTLMNSGNTTLKSLYRLAIEKIKKQNNL